MLGADSSSAPQRKQPRWIEVETLEPIYSVLGSHKSGSSSEGSRRQPEVDIVISSKTATARQRFPTCPRKPPIPPNYRESRLKQRQQEEEEEEAIYSVVNKSRAVVGSVEPEGSSSRREELENWLRTASRERGAMFNSSNNRDDHEWRREAGVSTPRGIVGLVGPYRIHSTPLDDPHRQYILEEEELVEEMVDSVSETASRSDFDQPNWRVVDERDNAPACNDEDDNETLVPDESEDEKSPRVAKEEELKAAEKSPISENWKLRESTTILSSVKYGKQERAVDVPDGASAISAASTVTKAKAASNEQHDKDSLNETGSTTGGTVDGGPGGAAGSSSNNNNNGASSGRAERSSAVGDGDSSPAGGGRDAPMRSHSPPPKSLVSRILARSRTPDDLLDHSEPFSQLWVVLSNVYGELVVVITMALCLAEVMDTPVPLLSLQGIFLMYMYVGSIAVIIGIYIWVLVDSCGSMRGGSGLRDAELGGASLTRFGSLKLAHISRARTAPTSFYIRVGALLFGLATLVFNGLEMAMHSMMQGAECLSDVIFVHPVLHGLFTFLQMHFLFVNSQVLVERFGLAARFGFTHLAATNIAVWARLVIWDSAQEWTYYVHVAQRGPLTDTSPLSLRRFPGSLTRQTIESNAPENIYHTPLPRYEPISQEQILQVVALQECLNKNSLGQLWTSSMPFLYPFIVQFSLIAAAVTFVMGQNVGRSSRLLHKKFHSMKDLPSSGRIGCDGSSKGLFMGILCMVAGIVVILIFLVVREEPNFPPATLSWLTCGTLIGILTLSGLMTSSGLVQIRQMSVVTRAPAALDSLLSNVALFGVQLYSVFTIVVCACSLATLPQTDEVEPNPEVEEMRGRHTMLLSVSVLQLLQCFAQSTLIAEASKRCCITRFQIMAKPGRQIITFLLFSNAVLWAFDTVVTQNWISQELQLQFFGVLAWGVISRIGLPLLIFYRFHSCVMLLEAWNKCYRTLHSDHPLN
ncbi:proton channel OtopLc isoform X2 [Nasonia vitripennis]|uniref:Otopetrin-3 n=1 Tax=Nasonia vitripennis TaxID=7425 RepID=A0A7M7T8W0_NASVI|nr:proton channel OtopLc isoform X2 [Nasonia vitripennis]